jgi:hypothetical protein
LARKNDGGSWHVAIGIVTAATPTARRADVERQARCASSAAGRSALATRAPGRVDLTRGANRRDRPPEAERHFRPCRQATAWIAGLSGEAASFLSGLCQGLCVSR